MIYTFIHSTCTLFLWKIWIFVHTWAFSWGLLPLQEIWLQKALPAYLPQSHFTVGDKSFSIGLYK